MTTCTPVYGFTYATGVDRPCDIDTTLCTFAGEVEAQLDRLDAIVDRVVDSVPMARVRLTIPFTFNNGVGGNRTLSIPFDSVDADTGAMVDLAVNPYTITLPRFGRYMMAFEMQAATVPAADNVSLAIAPRLTFPSDSWISDGSSPMFLNGSGIVYYGPTVPPYDMQVNQITLNYSFFSAGNITVNSAVMSAYWLGDLP